MPNLSNNRRPALTIAISTLLDRPLIDFDVRYPLGENWVYLVLVQSASSIAAAEIQEFRRYWSGREDVKVVVVEETGVTRSRNAAIKFAETPLLLFSDDDVRISPRGLGRIIEEFKRDSDLVVLTGKTTDNKGNPVKRYPTRPERLTLINCAKFGTVELAIRAEIVLEHDIRFDENFGAGAKNPIGDEYIFIADCIKHRLKAWYFPIAIAVHPHVSSGQIWGSDIHLRARAKALKRVFGPGRAFFMSLLFVGKHLRQFNDIRSVFKFLHQSLIHD